jgi:hypothetical protein
MFSEISAKKQNFYDCIQMISAIIYTQKWHASDARRTPPSMDKISMQNRRPYKNRESVHIKEVLQVIINSCRKETHTELESIQRIWRATFQSSITDNAQPTALKEDILLVTVKSSTVAHQLRFQLRDMIKKINQEIGSDRIHEIKLKTGNF